MSIDTKQYVEGGTSAMYTNLIVRHEFVGSLAASDLPALLRLLGNTSSTGRLDLVDNGWAGYMLFALGRIVGAGLERDRGMEALEAMALVLRGISFSFERY